MFDPTYPLFPIFSFVGFVLVLIPLPWHLHAWNSGTCYYMMWAALACLNQFVNSVVWADSVANFAPIWCDISIRIMMGASVGLPASSLCINRRLYYIANSRSISFTRAEKFKTILVDTLICVVFPLVYVALQYVVQGHRFNIFENVGCYPAIYNTLLAYFINAMWPAVIGLISGVYCTLSLLAFTRRRAEFSQFLTSHKSSLTISRYFRLMGLAMADILCTTPPALFVMILNTKASTVGPWRSWADTHLDYGRIVQVPAVIWREKHLAVVSIEFSRWVNPICALIFFAFFGFAGEARKHYSSAFWCLVKPFGWHPRFGDVESPSSPSIGHFKRYAKQLISNDSSLPPYSPPASSVITLNYKRKRSESLTVSLTHSNDKITNPMSDSYDLDTFPEAPATFRSETTAIVV